MISNAIVRARVSLNLPVLLFFLVFGLAFAGIAQNPGRMINDRLLKQTIAEVNESRTTQKNAVKRHRVLMGWVYRLLDGGARLIDVFPREDAMKLNKLLRTGNYSEACPKIDAAFKKLEEFASSNNSHKQVVRKVESVMVDATINTTVDRVRTITALPKSREVGDKSEGFASKILNCKQGKIVLKLTNEPKFIIEGDLPKEKSLSVNDSPFGFHEASVQSGRYMQNHDYSFAEDIGVAWDRDGLYLLWVSGQPKLNEGYRWRMYDNYFAQLPENINALKNISVAQFYTLPNIPGKTRSEKQRNRRRKLLS